MRIAYLSTFYPFRGGIAQFNAALFNYLSKENELKAFTFKRQYPNLLFPGTSQLVTENDTADKINSIRVLDSINPFSYFLASQKIKKFSPDLMLTKFWMPFFGPSLGYVAKSLKKAGTINISILDNVLPHEKRLGDIQFINYFLRQNHGFIVMSEAVKADLLKMKPDAKYRYITHPLYDHFGKKMDRTEARKKLGIAPDRKVLLFFGFIRSYKGLDLMLETLKYLPDEYLLIIAGEVYGDFKSYEDLIRKNNLENKVMLNVRYISDSEVPVFFSASDVCVLPYKTATQSGITGISYHFDLPVIATDVGGLKESIEPYRTGTVIAQPLENMLFAAIVDYFNFNLKESFENNIQNYKQIASWENFGNGILEFYKELKNNV